MHSLIYKYFNKEITASEKEELFALLRSDADLRNEFISFQNLYGITSLASSLNDDLLAGQMLSKFKKVQQKRNAFKFISHLSRYAAAVIITFTVTYLMLKPEPTIVVNEEVISYEEFITPPGQRAMVKLHDGTVVWLNAKSVLRYPNKFINGERRVELNGEAFFDVTHAEEIPFVVSTEKLDVKVLGTKFNIFAYNGYNEFRTALTEGSVKIFQSNKEDQALFLEENECAELVNNRLTKYAFSNEDFLLWREGIYSFDDIPFTDIVRKLELYYDISIQVSNKRLEAYQFSGKFRQRDGVESVLKTLRKVYYFSYVKDEENNRITIR